jgi:hypothetical protein
MGQWQNGVSSDVSSIEFSVAAFHELDRQRHRQFHPQSHVHQPRLFGHSDSEQLTMWSLLSLSQIAPESQGICNMWTMRNFAGPHEHQQINSDGERNKMPTEQCDSPTEESFRSTPGGTTAADE